MWTSFLEASLRSWHSPLKPPLNVEAEALLSEDLWAWVKRHRADDRSWRWIAKKLFTLSGGDIDVTPQYLNQLHTKRVAEQTAA